MKCFLLTFKLGMTESVAAVIEAGDEREAIGEAHRLGVGPVGEVLVFELLGPGRDIFPRNRLIRQVEWLAIGPVCSIGDCQRFVMEKSHRIFARSYSNRS